MQWNYSMPNESNEIQKPWRNAEIHSAGIYTGNFDVYWI